MRYISEMDMPSEQITKAEEEKEEKPFLKRINMNSVKKFFKASKATWISIAVLWVVFIVELLGTFIFQSGQSYGINQIGPTVLVKMGANSPFLVKFGQLHRLVMSNLLHANFQHIFGNTIIMVIFCAIVEAAFPFKIYLLTLVVGGIQANMFFDLIWCITGFTLKQLLVGASTSICAVMGLFIAQVIVLHKMGESAKKGKCIAGVLIVSLTLVSLQPHVSLLAHLGGLLSGLFFGLMVLPGSQQEALDSQQEAVKKLKTMGTMIFIGFSVILFGIWL